jgi:uncharacterized protein YacL (UPF0231 family)
MVVAVHDIGRKFRCLGLVRVKVSMSSEVCIKWLRERQEQLEMKLDKDIVVLCGVVER